MTNIPQGKVLNEHERQPLRVELAERKARHVELCKIDVYTDQYTPWERVEHSADLTASSHDIEAIEMSLETGRRIY
ncbi:hypothetical protein EXT67_21555 [Pectobacterium atrosepticum]|uniref:Uncharacterized protein n=1 Tax=Pectobacterium phage phiTE TaxID=1116482 RepID=K9L5L4_9CAUD|nr:hypothetical protein [Pectobacterium atrosepticum]YP_007392578.1 hypothetical protein phiTE_116 [Pectobacterium phage phiTE]AEZ66282.1 hypothetical protein phiTE_116 [Pectobacterium phage phiTE]MCL6318875.1 hypothetical protein [Pectobacterium atrosepticum]